MIINHQSPKYWLKDKKHQNRKQKNKWKKWNKNGLKVILKSIIVRLMNQRIFSFPEMMKWYISLITQRKFLSNLTHMLKSWVMVPNKNLFMSKILRKTYQSKMNQFRVYLKNQHILCFSCHHPWIAYEGKHILINNLINALKWMKKLQV